MYVRGRAPAKCHDGRCGWSDRMDVRQARDSETMRFSSPHDLTDTRARRSITLHSRHHHPPRPCPPTRRGRLPWPAGAAGEAPDPRDRRGRRHTLASVLAISAAAVLAGARSVAAIAEWATDAPGPVLAALGVRRDPLTRRCQVPAEATIRRVLARVDGDQFDRAVGAWLADRLRPPGPRRPTRSPRSSRCWPAWTSPAWSSRPTLCTPNATTPAS
jgi:DDE_Tnp_1-associated